MKMGECLLIPGDDVVEVVPPGMLALFIPWARDKIYLKDGTCHKANYHALIWNECGVPDVLLGYSARYLETPERLRMHTHYLCEVHRIYRTIRCPEESPDTVIDTAVDTVTDLSSGEVRITPRALRKFISEDNKPAICAYIHYLTADVSIPEISKFYGFNPFKNIVVLQFNK